MSDHHYEQEQLAALKDWWNKNGKLILVTILVALTANWGYRYYQSSQIESRQTASSYYDAMVVNVDRKKFSEAKAQADNIIKNYSKTVYSDMTAMLMAKIALEEKDFAKAREHYNWVIDHAKSKVTGDLAKLNLVKVMLHEEKNQEAFAYLQENQSGNLYQNQWLVLMGDVALLLKDSDAAKNYYQQALEKIGPENQGYNLVQMKKENVDVLGGEQTQL